VTNAGSCLRWSGHAQHRPADSALLEVLRFSKIWLEGLGIAVWKSFVYHLIVFHSWPYSYGSMMMVFVIYDRILYLNYFMLLDFATLTLGSHPFHGYLSCPLSSSCIYL